MNIGKIFFKVFEWGFNIFVFSFYSLKVLFTAVDQVSRNLSDEENEQENNINARITDDKLFNRRNGILKDDLVKAKNALKKVQVFGDKVDTNNSYQFPEERESLNEALRRKDPLKAKGDSYEKFIGKQFEEKGDLVIYYGFIKGYEDKGVDVIVISQENKTVNLVQCKNWERKVFKVDDIEKVYSKLNNYRPDFRILEPDDINYYLDNPRDAETIFTLLEYGISYKFRKTLYIANDKVIDLRIGEHLTMMTPTIFKYKDLKIVVRGMN
jgi:hypothetical protein